MASAMFNDSGLVALTQQVASLPQSSARVFLDHLRSTYLDRAFDIIVAVLALILIFPLLVVVSLLIAVSGRGPVVFGHERVGKDGRRFQCLKFRTMVTDADEQLAALLGESAEARLEWARDHKLQRDPRITWFGHFLRKSSIDELPQLINVLRGDMSIVGPRPIVAAEEVRYRRFIADYRSVRPGITGLWQVSGRNNTTYRRRVALDVTYARSKSLSFDMMILAKTVPAVLLARGSR